MSHIEAMKQALEALEIVLGDDECCVMTHSFAEDSIAALRQAITEAEKQEVSGLKLIHRADIDLTKKIEAEKQEPVAHCVVRPLQGNESIPQTRIEWKNGKSVAGPLYTSPPQRQPLTDEQIDEVYFKSDLEIERQYNQLYAFVRAIEAAHGIKGEA